MSKYSAITLCISLFISLDAFSQPSKGLRECLDTLCSASMQGRGRINTPAEGTSYLDNSGHDAAALYIASRFKEAGLYPVKGDGSFARSDDFVDIFPMSDSHGAGLNVVGFFPGLGRIPVGNYIVIGAHYDNLGIIRGKTYPGADSNASGVAALLDVADHFRRLRSEGRYYNTGIIFVAFDCYLDGRRGSERLWNMISGGLLHDPATGALIQPDMVSLMVDLDQIGSSLAPIHPFRKDYLIALGRESLPKWQAEKLQQANLAVSRRNNVQELDIGFDYYGSRNFTKTFYTLGDRKWFISAGIPTLYFTSGITQYNNTTDDLPSTLDYEVLSRRIELICTLIEEIL